jgi:hypothetical protein
MKYIFEEITRTETIYRLIDETCETQADKDHLVTVVKDTVHHKLVDMVLDELTDEQKLHFLEHIDDEAAHPTLLETLKKWVVDFETKLSSKAKEAEDELLLVISKAQGD